MAVRDYGPEIVELLAAGNAEQLAKLALEMNGILHKRQRAAEVRADAARKAPANWVQRIGEEWRRQVGAPNFGLIGKELSELVKDHGEDAVFHALLRYLAETPPDRTRHIAFFARDFKRWARPRFSQPIVVDGWLSPEAEMATRP